MKLTIQEVNKLAKKDFVLFFGGIFEASPWLAEKVVGKRPFRDCEHIFQALSDAVRRVGRDKQLQLIRAHPDLVGEAARAGKLGVASASEQSGAGLLELSLEEVKWFDRYNRAYREKYAFPFILCLRAVKGDKKRAILDSFEMRLHNDEEQERAAALQEIHKIARFRLDDAVE